jgi:AbrB family looped-hinge helix DNA binding protein
MANKVGAKGNIVIEKEIRDHLGIRPGWETIQLLRDGHVEIHFLPPPRPGVSAGILRPAGDVPWLQDEEALHEAIDRSMEEAVLERYGAGAPEPAG